MTDHEWRDVVRRLTANWPHQLPPESALAKWRQDLAGAPVEQVHAAIEALYRDGREFAPNGAQVLGKLAELRSDAPDHAGAWELVREAIRKWGSYRETEALIWLDAQDECTAATVRRLGWLEICLYDGDEAVLRAQFREAYKATVADRRKRDTYRGLHGTGLAQLERHNQPRPLGDVVRELPEQSEAA